ncbi:MAG: hypothetical protein ACYC8T_18310 [Myxococcaceae bacterium]
MSHPGVSKRQKELARLERRKVKDAERTERKKEKANKPAADTNGEDPDIAGIIPGPQPLPE